MISMKERDYGAPPRDYSSKYGGRGNDRSGERIARGWSAWFSAVAGSCVLYIVLGWYSIQSFHLPLTPEISYCWLPSAVMPAFAIFIGRLRPVLLGTFVGAIVLGLMYSGPKSCDAPLYAFSLAAVASLQLFCFYFIALNAILSDCRGLVVRVANMLMLLQYIVLVSFVGGLVTTSVRSFESGISAQDAVLSFLLFSVGDAGPSIAAVLAFALPVLLTIVAPGLMQWNRFLQLGIRVRNKWALLEVEVARNNWHLKEWFISRIRTYDMITNFGEYFRQMNEDEISCWEVREELIVQFVHVKIAEYGLDETKLPRVRLLVDILHFGLQIYHDILVLITPGIHEKTIVRSRFRRNRI